MQLKNTIKPNKYRIIKLEKFLGRQSVIFLPYPPTLPLLGMEPKTNAWQRPYYYFIPAQKAVLFQPFCYSSC